MEEFFVNLLKDLPITVGILAVFLITQRGNDQVQNRVLDLFGNMSRAIDALRISVEALKDSVEAQTKATEARELLVDTQVQKITELADQVQRIADVLK